MADLAHILKKTELRSKTLPKPQQTVRIANGPRPYDEEAKTFQTVNDSTQRTRERLGNDSGTKSLQLGNDSGTKSLQLGNDSGTNTDDLGNDSGTTREQSPTISGTTREQSPTISGTTREQMAYDSGTNIVPGISTREQNLSDSGTRRIKMAPDSGTNIAPEVSTREQNLSDSGTNSGTKPKLPSSEQELKVLRFILAEQLKNDEAKTPLLSRSRISDATGVPHQNVKIVLSRLVARACLLRHEMSNSRTVGGASFSVPRSIRRALQETISGTKSGTIPTLVSSSDLKTTTTDKDRADRFQSASERFGLNDVGIGANDLLQIWRKGAFQAEEDFIGSLEHIAFYLSTTEAKTLTHPKAWISSQLTKGFYPAPAGFKSWEERQAEARLTAKRERLERIEELKRQEIDADFELWLADLDVAAKKAHLRGTPFADDPNSRLAKTLLREQFLKQNGGELGTAV